MGLTYVGRHSWKAIKNTLDAGKIPVEVMILAREGIPDGVSEGVARPRVRGVQDTGRRTRVQVPGLVLRRR